MLRVLTYHRIAEPKDSQTLNPRSISATPAGFAKQMRYVAEHWHAVSMPQVLEAMAQRAPLPKRAVLITFDDAYCDFGEIAWPILQHFRLPATLFVPTDYPDQPQRSFWWDRLYRAIFLTSSSEVYVMPLGVLLLRNSVERYRSLWRVQNYAKTIAHAEAMALVDEICAKLDSQPLVQKHTLSWEELRQLAKAGVTLGAHTQTHPIMTQIAPAEIRREISGSQKALQREIGAALPIFCYPSGSHDDTVVAILKEEGFVAAFTTLDGHNNLRSTDPLRLRRTNITKRTSTPIFRFRLSRLGAQFDRWRH
jgi:peptidoglycan/xylan/chitin deacetylase (PgdA/CDA1 family)